MTVLRQILREIRLNLPHGKKVQRQPLTSYILNHYRKNQLTENQYCKGSLEMSHLASSYATYLTNQRLWLKVHQEYHAKSERSVADTAKIVGFKLPHDPK